LEQSIQPFIRIAQIRAQDILCGIDAITEIVGSISDKQISEPMEA
jgi:hypothetical protein